MHLRFPSPWYVQNQLTLRDIQLTRTEHGNENAWVRQLNRYTDRIFGSR